MSGNPRPMSGNTRPALERALVLSRDLLAAATEADLQALARLDAERLTLLQLVHPERGRLGGEDRQTLRDIAELNDRAIGLMEHHRRIKERDLDMAAVGRRAVAAYANTRLER